MKYKAGDIVKLKSWADMAREFGVDEDGDILSTITFTSNYKELCGQKVTINKVDDDESFTIEGCHPLSFFSFDNIEDK